MTSGFKKVLMLVWYEERNKMWTPDLTGSLLPATLFLNHHIPGKSWMHKALICGCNQLFTSATISIWSRLAFYLSSFINSIIWHKDIQSVWKDCAGTSLCLCCSKVDMHKHVAVTDRCTSADPLCLLLVDKKGEVICAGLAQKAN